MLHITALLNNTDHSSLTEILASIDFISTLLEQRFKEYFKVPDLFEMSLTWAQWGLIKTRWSTIFSIKNLNRKYISWTASSCRSIVSAWFAGVSWIKQLAEWAMNILVYEVGQVLALDLSEANESLSIINALGINPRFRLLPGTSNMVTACAGAIFAARLEFTSRSKFAPLFKNSWDHDWCM